MKRKHLIWLGLLCVGCAPQATKTPQEKPHTLALFALLEDGHKVTEKTIFTGRAKLELAVEGKEAPSTVVVVAYADGGSDSPPEISPQVMPLNPGEEQLIRYQVDPKMKDGRLYVAVMPQGSQEDFTALVKDWQKSPQSGTGKVVQDRLTGWMEHQDQELMHVGLVPANVGGVRLVSAQPAQPAAKGGFVNQESSNSLPKKEQQQSPRWQDVADSVGSSAGQPGVFSYPIRFPKR